MLGSPSAFGIRFSFWLMEALGLDLTRMEMEMVFHWVYYQRHETGCQTKAQDLADAEES